MSLTGSIGTKPEIGMAGEAEDIALLSPTVTPNERLARYNQGVATAGLALWKSRLYTVPVAIAITIIYISAGVIASYFDHRASTQQLWFKRWARAVLGFVGVRLQVDGLERLAHGEHYVVVSNHASLFDIPVLGEALPLHVRYMAKRELLKVPFIGRWIRVGGHLPIDRSDPRKALKSMSEAADAVRERDLNVVVFAEGTRSDEGVGSFKDGAAYLAIKSGTPLLPVAVNGTQRVLRNKTSLLQGGDVRVRIGEPISTVGLELKDRKPLTERLEAEVRALYDGAARPAHAETLAHKS